MPLQRQRLQVGKNQLFFPAWLEPCTALQKPYDYRHINHIRFIFRGTTKPTGVSSSGKAAYFTALFPYVILLTLLVRGVTLPGAYEGIMFYITPQWDKILEAKVWYAAVTQCFFSLAISFGPIVMFSSYNKFKQPIYRDSIIITFVDTGTSLLAGVTIFAILGHLAHELDVDITEVVKGGAGLAFISYPEAIAKMAFLPQVKLKIYRF
ncbi:hypothetical protein QYM36_006572 [Artemia franciscana]|uniref:Sodium-dependent nutrient amino acid transporter 1 n=1 Tax=Artemia franciscana TaxID=6661 RepID=A0AA88HWY2_ARTSF|nr:hypothetical protein QYM36_006572 [Artemia franciscana]